MKILVITPTFLPIIGGAELAIYEVFRRIAKTHDVGLITPEVPAILQDSYSMKEYSDGLNFPVWRYPDKFTLLRRRLQYYSCGMIPPFSISAIKPIKNIIKKFNPDVINAYYMTGTGLAAIAGKIFLKVPVILNFIGRDVPGSGTPPLWKYYDRLLASLSSDLTYVSEYCRDSIYGTNRNTRGHIIYLGVDISKFNPQNEGDKIRERLGCGKNHTLLFSLQRLSPEKRTDILILSMQHLLEQSPLTKLVIGGEGPQKLQLQALTQNLGLSESILFSGFIPEDELPYFFAACDIFVFHSTYETFGIVLAQAMASGKPIVSVNSSAIPEVVPDGTNGILAEPLNPESLAKAILRVQNSSELRKQLSTNNRKRAIELFDLDRVAHQYELVLESAACPQNDWIQ